MWGHRFLYIGIPLLGGVAAAAFFLEGWFWKILLIIIVLGAAVLLSLKSLFEKKAALKNPPSPDPEVGRFIEKHIPFYNELSVTEKDLFGKEVSRYMIITDWIGQGMDSVPVDAKAAQSIYIVAAWWPAIEELYELFSRVAFYSHPFLSPQFPEDVHTCEFETTDGVMIYSMEQVLPGIVNSDFINIVSYNNFHAMCTYENLEVENSSLSREELDTAEKQVGLKIHSLALLLSRLLHNSINSKGLTKEEKVIIEKRFPHLLIKN